MVNGSQGLFELRPAIGLQYQITPSVALTGTGAIDYSPKAAHFYAPISRTELLFGLTFRF